MEFEGVDMSGLAVPALYVRIVGQPIQYGIKIKRAYLFADERYRGIMDGISGDDVKDPSVLFGRASQRR